MVLRSSTDRNGRYLERDERRVSEREGALGEVGRYSGT